MRLLQIGSRVRLRYMDYPEAEIVGVFFGGDRYMVRLTECGLSKIYHYSSLEVTV